MKYYIPSTRNLMKEEKIKQTNKHRGSKQQENASRKLKEERKQTGNERTNDRGKKEARKKQSTVMKHDRKHVCTQDGKQSGSKGSEQEVTRNQPQT